MKKPDEKIAAALKWLTITAFILNLAVLPMLPFLLSLRYNFSTRAEQVISFLPLDPEAMPEYITSLVFFLCCGTCTAVMLWQSRGLLGNLSHRKAFVMENVRYIERASVCLFLISALALARTVVWLTMYSFAQVLMAYNTLFVPVFFVAGLLFKILAGLFREATRIKEENDLTI